MDWAGLIVNALLFPYLNDAVKMLEANYSTADDIDTAMKTGCSLPMGPFDLLDVVGLDVALAIEREYLPRVPRARLRPGSALEHLRHRRLLRAQVQPRLPHLRLTHRQAISQHTRASASPRCSRGGSRFPGVRRRMGGVSPKRRPSKHARPHVPLDVVRIQGGATREDSYRGLRWTARAVSGASATRPYLCPGCQQDIEPGFPTSSCGRPGIGGVDDRRHWHTGRWQRRDARPSGNAYR